MGDQCRRDLGNYDAARKLYEGLLARYPESTQAMRAQRGIVNIDIKAGNYEAAEAGVKTILARYANHDDLPQAFYWLGNDYLNARQDDKAAQCYQYVIDNRPDSNAVMSSWAGMGRVHVRRGDDQAALDVIDMMITDFNDNPEVATAVFQIGEEYYNRAYGELNQGRQLDSEESFRGAIRVWERVISETPNANSTTMAHAHYFSALCHRELGDRGKAIEYFQETVSRWPGYRFSWNAQFLIARSFEELVRRKEIPPGDAAVMIRYACQEIITEYPDCLAVKAAGDMLKRWNSVN